MKAFLTTLLLTCASSMMSAASWTPPSIPVGMGLPPTGQEFYLYMPEKGMYASKGTTWGTHAALTDSYDSALLYTMENNGNYHRLHSNGAGNTGYLFIDNASGSVYTDYNTQDITCSYFLLTSQPDGSFRIGVPTASKWYDALSDAWLGWNPTNIDKNPQGGSLGTNIGLFMFPDDGSNLVDWRYVLTSDLPLYEARLQLCDLLNEAEAEGVDTSEAGGVYANSSSTLEAVLDAYNQLTVAMGGGTDMTGLISNPDFSGNVNGWTVDMPGAQNKGYQSSSYSNGNIRISQFAEAWISTGNTLGAGKIWQTITGLEEGKYKLEADIIACNQGMSGTSQYATDAYLFVDYQAYYSEPVYSLNGQPQHFSLTFYNISDAVTIGLQTLATTNANWVAIDNVRLTYYGKETSDATAVSVSPQQVTTTLGGHQQLTATVTATSAYFAKATWSSDNPSVATVDGNGRVTGQWPGTTTIRATAIGSSLSATATVTVEPNHPEKLVINEIQVANIDMFIDPSFNYGGWVELYNPTEQDISLGNLWVSDDTANLKKHQLPADQGTVTAGGFKNLWFDHYDQGIKQYSAEAYKQVDFKLDFDGGTIYLSDIDGNLLLSQTYPPATTRTSYARASDGAATWGTTAAPTPENSNNGSTFATTRLATPAVSHDATVYTDPFTVSVTIPAGATLIYTTDGSTPTLQNGQTSTTGQFSVSGGSQVYRFRLFQDGYLPSAVVTRSFIYQDKDYYLPIVSLTTASENLYDDTIGVYVDGTNGTSGNNRSSSNKNRSWERPVNFEYLVPDEQGEYSVALSQECDFEVSGGWSRHFSPGSSFRLTGKKQYEGNNFLACSFFGQKPYIRSKGIMVRNGGNDNSCRIKDAAIHQIVQRSGFYVDLQSWQPAHIFMNGAYQFMFNIREPSNKNNGYANYGMDTDLMDQFEINYVEGYVQKNGTDTAFRRWMALAEQLAANPTDASLYEEICRLVDVDEFCNYMALQCYIGSSDWITNCNNVKGYRSHEDGGKFHMVFFDVDAAFYTRKIITQLEGKRADSRFDTGKNFLIDIFLNMLCHEGFKKQFVDTFCLVGGSVFEPTRSTAIINEMVSLTTKALGFDGNSPESSANSLISTITNADNRTNRIGFMGDYFGLTEGVDVIVASNTDGARLQVNGLDVPTARFSGTLYRPVTLTAQAPAGYRFDGWTDSDGNTVSADSVFTLSNQNYNLVASFSRLEDAKLIDALAMPVKVNEVSAANSVYVNDYFKKNDWIELYNNTDTDLNAAGLYVSDNVDDPLKYQIPSNTALNTIIPANGHLVVWADALTAVTQLHAPFKLSNTSGEMVVVTSSEEFVKNNTDYFSAHPDLQGFADGLTYKSHEGTQSVGRYPDGGNHFYRMSRPTIEQQNALLTTDERTGTDTGIMDLGQTTFTLELAEGWNWISHPLSDAIAVTTFSEEADRILSHTLEAYYSTESGSMKGQLKQLTSAQLYKVNMYEPYIYKFDGKVLANTPPVNLRAGWNWIGYPLTRTQTIPEALATSAVEEGDVIVGQTGFSVYSKATGWEGTLSSFLPGSGYMYKSGRAKSLSFRRPTDAAVRLRRSQRKTATAARYDFDPHAYPNVMGVIGKVECEGKPLLTDELTIVTYADSVCRGAGRYAGGKVFLTVYGDAGEPLTFKAFDGQGNEYGVEETLPFRADIEGTLSEPFVFTLTGHLPQPDAVAIAAVTDETGKVANAVVSICDLGGRQLPVTTLSALPKGIYIVRRQGGQTQKVMIP